MQYQKNVQSAAALQQVINVAQQENANSMYAMVTGNRHEFQQL